MNRPARNGGGCLLVVECSDSDAGQDSDLVGASEFSGSHSVVEGCLLAGAILSGPVTQSASNFVFDVGVGVEGGWNLDLTA